MRQYPLGEELLLYLPGPRRAHALNGSARAIWELCDGAHTVDDISRRLAGPLGVSVTDLKPDIVRAVGELVSLGLLEAP